METNLTNQRLDWIDFARGLGILLVITGHASISLLPKYFIYGFHIPLFFVITGICFNVKTDDKFAPFLLKKIRTILVPYIFISCVWIIIDSLTALFRHSFSLQFFIDNAKLYVFQRHYRAVWFLACIFLSEIIVFFLVKVLQRFKDVRMITLGVIVFFFILSLFYTRYSSAKLPWCADSTLTAVPFILSGWLIKDKIKQQSIFDIKLPTCILLFVISLIANVINVIGFYGSNKLDFSNGEFGNHFLYLSSAFMGTFGVFGIAKLVKKNRIINYIGQNSIIFFTVHPMIFKLFYFLPQPETPAAVILFNLFFCVVIVVTTAAIYLINELICKTRLCVLIGKRYKKAE